VAYAVVFDRRCVVDLSAYLRDRAAEAATCCGRRGWRANILAQGRGRLTCDNLFLVLLGIGSEAKSLVCKGQVR